MPANELTVHISCAGRRVELIRCFRQDAARLGVRLRIVAADAHSGLSAACHEADLAVEVPQCSSADFVARMLAVCRDQGVGLVVPTIDPELSAWASARESFAAAGVRLLVADPTVVKLAGDKFATATVLAEHGVRTPRTLRLEDYRMNPTALDWPVIFKPISGSSSSGVFLSRTLAEALAISDQPGLIVQERWNGREMTVNVFFDQQGKLRCAVPHERIEVRAGEVSKGMTRRLPALEQVAEKLAVALPGFAGPLCFQAVVTDSGEFAVFEINARFGCGYPLAHRAGERFSQWLLEEACGLPSTANNDWKEGVTMLRYDSAVFLND
jgi:carbamoyl-phosphate synthase large subunit